MNATRSIVILAVALAGASLSGPASAQLLRRPVACESCIGNWYYFDHAYDPSSGSATEDWSCAGSTYDDHRGTDFSLIGGNGAIDAGHAVVAAADGVVAVAHDGEFDHCTACGGTGCGTSAGYGYGNYVTINHGDRKTTYAHMRTGSIRVAVGDTVRCGQIIGEIGSAGCSTGAHLHVELRALGGTSATAYDPFHGACSSAASAWVSQGPHRGMPAPTCEDGSTTMPPVTPTCPSGTYAIWTCSADRTERVRCISGVVETEECAAGCESRPVGTDDVCAPEPPPPTTPVDADGDGYDVDADCDDADPGRHPLAQELCDDGVDQDCDGRDCVTGSDAGSPVLDGGVPALPPPGADGGTSPPPSGSPPAESLELAGTCAVGHGARPLGAIAAAFVLALAVARRRRRMG